MPMNREQIIVALKEEIESLHIALKALTPLEYKFTQYSQAVPVSKDMAADDPYDVFDKLPKALAKAQNANIEALTKQALGEKTHTKWNFAKRSQVSKAYWKAYRALKAKGLTKLEVRRRLKLRRKPWTA